ncbi:MAG: hypothetical protein COS84_09365 [Armatimonadetes bacterium CG07_land_8_20_14_0_80_40_9]|nr:MAG: hypothetical protein COS84_09365 [Armatimonadetes bacterium CG07_land_8_20_14_0_80_40_9]
MYYTIFLKIFLIFLDKRLKIGYNKVVKLSWVSNLTKMLKKMFKFSSFGYLKDGSLIIPGGVTRLQG